MKVYHLVSQEKTNKNYDLKKLMLFFRPIEEVDRALANIAITRSKSARGTNGGKEHAYLANKSLSSEPPTYICTSFLSSISVSLEHLRANQPVCVYGMAFFMQT